MKMMKPLAVMLLIAGVSGCASKSATPKLDYQSQNNKIVSLEVPPDLNDPRNGELYSLPKAQLPVRMPLPSVPARMAAKAC